MSALRVSAGERKGITGDERIFLETTGAVLSISHDMMEAGGREVLSHYCRVMAVLRSHVKSISKFGNIL